MSTRHHRPQRILLVVSRSAQDCQGKAIRIADRAEFQFKSLKELTAWLLAPATSDPVPPTEES